MYESFFGLQSPAFELSPDPRFLWQSETHQEGLAALYYGITRRKGFILLSGEVGSGKTTLLRAALERLPDGVETASVMNTANLRPLDLLKLIAAEFRIEASFDTKADYLIAFNRYLLDCLGRGVRVLLIVDEAQNLEPAVLEELRLLSNLETDSQKLLQIVLTGQPELREKLALPRLRQLRQRIAIEHHLDCLGAPDVVPYLSHRIAVAGGSFDEVFAPGVEDIFHAFSGGCPRLLSLLADRSLLSAFARKLRPAPEAVIADKAKELARARGDDLLARIHAEG